MVGDNAPWLLDKWQREGMIRGCDGAVAELLPIPTVDGVALHRCYCAQLKADAHGVSMHIEWEDGARF